MALSARLPEFPWDRLADAGANARAHPDGVVDLSVGTPVDPTPEVVQDALRAAADAPGYPYTAGTVVLREAVSGWLARRCGVPNHDPAAVLPTIGSKELVAWLPTLLGLGPGDRVGHPALAYPTYDVGARLAGAEPVPVAAGELPDPAGMRLLWLNSPANPSGAVLDAAGLRELVTWGRKHDVLIASDECYLELGWEASPLSVLRPDVSGGSPAGVLAVSSLSKRSNLAGYRAGFVAGDAAVVQELLAVRKHAGMIVPAPVQAAMVAALGDDGHVDAQRKRYAVRRDRLRAALTAWGLTIEESAAGLYLWGTRGEGCWSTVDALANLGILVAPGDFYGPAGVRHVRVALTATDERVEAGVARLAS